MKCQRPSLFLCIVVSLMTVAGCGFDASSFSTGEHSKIETTVQGKDVVGGRVSGGYPSAALESVFICRGRTEPWQVGTFGDFALDGLADCTDGDVVAVLTNGVELHSFLSRPPLANADMVVTQKDNWGDEYSTSITVNGNQSPIFVSQLTDMAYNVGVLAVDDFLNRYFTNDLACTNPVYTDYLSSPPAAYAKIRDMVDYLKKGAPLVTCNGEPPAEGTFNGIVASAGGPAPVNTVLNGYFGTIGVDYAADQPGTLDAIRNAADELLGTPVHVDYRRFLKSLSFRIGSQIVNDYLNSVFPPTGPPVDYVATEPTPAVMKAAIARFFSLYPASGAVVSGSSRAFTVSGVTPPPMVWSVMEPDGGSITADGVYTARKVNPGESFTYHVNATNKYLPAMTATAQVTVTGESETWVAEVPDPGSPAHPPVAVSVTIDSRGEDGIRYLGRIDSPLLPQGSVTVTDDSVDDRISFNRGDVYYGNGYFFEAAPDKDKKVSGALVSVRGFSDRLMSGSVTIVEGAKTYFFPGVTFLRQ